MTTQEVYNQAKADLASTGALRLGTYPPPTDLGPAFAAAFIMYLEYCEHDAVKPGGHSLANLLDRLAQAWNLIS